MCWASSLYTTQYKCVGIKRYEVDL